MTVVLLLASGIGAYASFFAQPAAKPAVNPPIVWNQPAPSESAKPAVVCGMTLVPADPNTDPAIKRPAPNPTRFPMQTREPHICRR